MQSTSTAYQTFIYGSTPSRSPCAPSSLPGSTVTVPDRPPGNSLSGGRVNAMHSPNSPQIQMQCINLLHATARGRAQHSRAGQGRDSAEHCSLGRHSRQLRAVAGTGQGDEVGDGEWNETQSPRRQSADWPACLWQTCALNA